MKKNKILILCIILAVLSLGLGGYIIYNKVNESNSRKKTDTTLVKNKDNSDSSPLENNNEDNVNEQQDFISYSENGVTIDCEDIHFTAYIDNGNLYYQMDNNSATKKYNALTNIKKIKVFNTGTGIRFQIFLITESGKVYSTTEIFDEELSFEETEFFKNYEVADIISKTGEIKEEYVVLLKNGEKTTVTVTLDI